MPLIPCIQYKRTYLFIYIIMFCTLLIYDMQSTLIYLCV